MLLIKLRKARRTKPRLRDRTAKAANQRQTAKAANADQSTEQAGRIRRMLRTKTQRKGSSRRTSRLSRSTSIFQNSRILQRRRPVKFQQGRRIQGSQNWQGQRYAVFRNYKSEWHDQNWWHDHYGNNFMFVFGAPYYWNAGLLVPSLGLQSQRVLCVGWAYLRLQSHATRPGNCQRAVGASTTRLLPRRSGWSYWTAHAWGDRGLSTRSRPLHDIHDRSANTSVARHRIVTTADFSKSRREMFFDGGFLSIQTAAFCIALLHQNRLAGDTCACRSRN